MSNLIERLREFYLRNGTGFCLEAADELERLQRENEQLRKELADKIHLLAESSADIAALKAQSTEPVAEMKDLNTMLVMNAEIASLKQQLAEAQAKLAAVERDAKRYKAIRDKDFHVHKLFETYDCASSTANLESFFCLDDLDSAIDQAMWEGE